MKISQTLPWFVLCVAALGCSAGVEPIQNRVDEEELGQASERLLAASCNDEASAWGMSSDLVTCNPPTLWQFPIRYESIASWSAADKTAITAAMDAWKSATGGLATFQELPTGSTVTPRVKFDVQAPYCQSSVGRVTGSVQTVNLRGCGTPTATHELGHLLGFEHEHIRADRDRYLNVRQDKFCNPVGCGSNPTTNVCGAPGPANCDSNQLFYDSVRHCSTSGTIGGYQLGAFDFSSIMLYGSGFPSEECCAGHEGGCGMVRRDNGGLVSGASTVSAGDASALFELYRAQEGWQILRPIVRTDPGATAPLDTRLTATAAVTGSPALARWGTSDLVALARGSDQHMYYKVDPGGGNSFPTGSWIDIGGDFTSDPAAVSWAPGRLDVVGVGTDGNLWHKWYLNGTWAPAWGSLGRPTSAAISAPAIASWGVDRLDIFVRSNDALYQKSWTTAGWSGWTNLGTAIQGKPAAVSWGPNRIDVVATGTDGHVYHKPYQDGTWYGWNALGGNVAPGTSPAIASSGVNKLNIYIKGDNGRLWHKAWANGWSAFFDIGGLPIGSPGAYTATSGRAHVAVRINNGSYDGVWHRYWN